MNAPSKRKRAIDNRQSTQDGKSDLISAAVDTVLHVEDVVLDLDVDQADRGGPNVDVPRRQPGDEGAVRPGRLRLRPRRTTADEIPKGHTGPICQVAGAGQRRRSCGLQHLRGHYELS